MTSNSTNSFLIGIQTKCGLVRAFEVRIKGHDVYVNYSDCSTPEAHSSYHASGQYHIKIGKRYVQWDGGASGTMEPMKLFRTPPGSVFGRSLCWTVGWKISELDRVLPVLSETADMTVDAQRLNPDLVLGFEVSVVGPEARKQQSIVGFPIIDSAQFGGDTRAEINAFLLTEDTYL